MCEEYKTTDRVGGKFQFAFLDDPIFVFGRTGQIGLSVSAISNGCKFAVHGVCKKEV
jgi:hypothetical protein